MIRFHIDPIRIHDGHTGLIIDEAVSVETVSRGIHEMQAVSDITRTEIICDQ